MAARRAQIAGPEATTSPSSAVAPASRPADARGHTDRRDTLIALVRALARDAARTDHASEAA